MEKIFSCRNCVQNCGQSMLIGRGAGFCLRHRSVILKPDRTTCKYHHRKDLPRFVVEESTREHAGEFAEFPGLVDLLTREPIDTIHYSELHYWRTRTFDPVLHAMALYHKMPGRKWILIQSMSGGLDGRRSLTHACLVRRYLDTCNNWRSSVRLVLGVALELPNRPTFAPNDLVNGAADVEDAVWDVVFARIASLQEYGWHAGLSKLRWITDELNGALLDFDWARLQVKFRDSVQEIESTIISHAENQGSFFTQPEDSDVDEE